MCASGLYGPRAFRPIAGWFAPSLFSPHFTPDVRPIDFFGVFHLLIYKKWDFFYEIQAKAWCGSVGGGSMHMDIQAHFMATQ